jgi:hypothetical protein
MGPAGLAPVDPKRDGEGGAHLNMIGGPAVGEWIKHGRDREGDPELLAVLGGKLKLRLARAGHPDQRVGDDLVAVRAVGREFAVVQVLGTGAGGGGRSWVVLASCWLGTCQLAGLPFGLTAPATTSWAEPELLEMGRAGGLELVEGLGHGRAARLEGAAGET